MMLEAIIALVGIALLAIVVIVSIADSFYQQARREQRLLHRTR